MYIVGIDASVASPAMCIFKDDKTALLTYSKYFKVKEEDFHFQNDDFVVGAVKQPKKFDGDDFDKLIHVCDSFMRFADSVIGNDDAHFFFEGYSMHGVGRITMLVEITSLMKYHIKRRGWNLSGIFAPTSIKKQIGGRGNLKKDEIYETGWNNDKIKNLLSELDKSGHGWKKSGTWVSDILDAWAVAEMGRRMLNE